MGRKKYDQLLENSKQAPELKETLREDFEVGINDKGELFVSYRAVCEAVGCSCSRRLQLQPTAATASWSFPTSNRFLIYRN